MSSDGFVDIKVDLIVKDAIAKSEALKKAFEKLDLGSGLDKQAEELVTALKKVDSIAGETESSTKKVSNSTKELTEEEKKAAESAKKQSEEQKKAAQEAKKLKESQDQLKGSLQSSGVYYDKLAQGIEAANLKTSASIAKFSSLKVQLGATKIEVQQAATEYKKLSSTEGENSVKTQQAKNKYTELLGTEKQLSLETAALGQKVGNLSPKMAASADKAGIMSERFKSAGDKMTAVGTKATIGLSVPIVGALAASSNAAISFDSEIKSMGALLDDGTVSSKTLSAQLDNLGAASKKWSVEYGVSTANINSGMSELIKKGYSYKQTLGAMPSILDATRASGDDFNDVMSVSTSTLEQFGLKSNNTNQMLANTQRVTDSLTFVANKTSAGFSDMGYAMEYVGPVAHGLGMSLEETSAAIGLMSNQGIEGQKAGTALRGSLSALLNPSAANVEGFKKLGVSVSDYKKGAITLPDILDKIKANTKDMTKQQRQSALALAFGTEAQSGMNILVNEGGDALRKLTKETQNAKGYTHELAETMNNTSQANVQKFKSAINVLGITFGSQLLPSITGLVKEGTKLVQWFADLDEGTQKSIIKTALFVAAMGPTIGAIGKTSNAIGGLYGGYKKLIEFSGRGKSELDVLSEILTTVKGSAAGATPELEAAAGGIVKTATGAEGASASVGLFGGALGSALPIIGGIGLALGVGIGVWELWGKKAVESANRTARWGTDVGDSADKSLTKMQNFSTNVSNALAGFSSKSSSTTKAVSADFNGMFKQLESDSKKSMTKLQKDVDELPAFAKAAAQKDLANKKQSNQAILADAKKQNKLVKSVLSQHNGDVSKLSADEKQIVLNARTRITTDELKMLNIGGKAKKVVLESLNGDISKLSRTQREQNVQDLSTQYTKEKKIYESQSKTIEKAYKDGAISADTYKASMKKLEASHKSSVDNMAAATLKLDRANGKSKNEIEQDLGVYETSYKRAAEIVDGQTKKMSKSTSVIAADTNTMSKTTAKANAQWNKLIFDPKTGKVKTNAQAEITKASKSEKGWDQLKFDLKHANLSTNAKNMIGVAALANGHWDDFTWEEKKALIKSNAAKTATEALYNAGVWNKLSLKQKKALISSNSKQTSVQAVFDAKQWNNLSWEDQDALVVSNAGQKIMDAMSANGTWNNLTFDQQRAIVTSNSKEEIAKAVFASEDWKKLKFKQLKAIVVTNAGKEVMGALKANGSWESLDFETKKAIVESNSTEAIRKAVMDSGDWNTLSFEEQELLVEDKASKKIMDALENAGTWNKLDVKTQQAVVQSKGIPQLTDSILKMGNWNELPMDMKKLLVSNDDAKQKLQDAGILVDAYDTNNPLPKDLTANSANLDTVLKAAHLNITGYDAVNPNSKYLNANNQNFIGKVTQSESMMDQYNKLPANLKELLASNNDVQGKIFSSKTLLAKYNALSPKMKKLIAETYGFDAPVGKSNEKLNLLDKNNPKTKKIKADSTNLTNNVINSNSALDKLSRNNPKQKKLKADSSNAVNNSDKARSHVDKFGKSKPKKPTLNVNKSLVTSGVNSAQRKIDGLKGKTVTIHVNTIQTTTRHKKNAKGTSDFSGGTTWLGDGGREEPYLTPAGEFGVSPAEWSLFDLPRHTKIWPSMSAFESELPKLPQFSGASGIAEMFQATPEMAGSVNVSQPVNNVTMAAPDNRSVLEKLDKLISVIADKTIGVDVKLSGTSIFSELYPLFKQQMDNDLLIELSKGGGA